MAASDTGPTAKLGGPVMPGRPTEQLAALAKAVVTHGYINHMKADALASSK